MSSHSGILGSKAAYAYPRLFAVCCALHLSQKLSYPPIGFPAQTLTSTSAGIIDHNDLKTHLTILFFHLQLVHQKVFKIIHRHHPYAAKHLCDVHPNSIAIIFPVGFSLPFGSTLLSTHMTNHTLCMNMKTVLDSMA